MTVFFLGGGGLRGHGLTKDLKLLRPMTSESLVFCKLQLDQEEIGRWSQLASPPPPPHERLLITLARLNPRDKR